MEEEDQDLQRALEESMRKGKEEEDRGEMEEDQELQQAIHQSLQSAAYQGEGGDAVEAVALSEEAQLGHYAQRAEHFRRAGEPAGLRNVGNSCYANSLLQTYYHLPPVRDLIYGLARPPGMLDELQQLFAAMQLSEQPAVSPRAVVRRLMASSAGVGQQQDVSEINDRFLSQLSASLDGLPGAPPGGVEALFAMTLLQHCVVDGEPAQVDEQRLRATQLLVQVDAGIRDVYDALHACLVDDVPEYRLADGPTPRHATKFTFLEQPPPVLVLQLGRTRFSAATSSAFKLHHRCDVPAHLTLDRFLASHRVQRTALHARRTELLRQLAALHPEASASAFSTLFSLLSNPALSSSSALKGELKQFSNHYESVCEDLRTKLRQVQAESEAWVAEMPQQCRYVLVGAWMHAGEAEAGHYWTYLRSRPDGGWRKYNDVDVSDLEEHAVLDDAAGVGDRSASVLIYAREELAQNWRNRMDGCSGAEKARVPADCVAAVAHENADYRRRVQVHRCALARRVAAPALHALHDMREHLRSRGPLAAMLRSSRLYAAHVAGETAVLCAEVRQSARAVFADRWREALTDDLGPLVAQSVGVPVDSLLVESAEFEWEPRFRAYRALCFYEHAAWERLHSGEDAKSALPLLALAVRALLETDAPEERRLELAALLRLAARDAADCLDKERLEDAIVRAAKVRDLAAVLDPNHDFLAPLERILPGFSALLPPLAPVLSPEEPFLLANAQPEDFWDSFPLSFADLVRRLRYNP